MIQKQNVPEQLQEIVDLRTRLLTVATQVRTGTRELRAQLAELRKLRGQYLDRTSMLNRIIAADLSGILGSVDPQIAAAQQAVEGLSADPDGTVGYVDSARPEAQR